MTYTHRPSHTVPKKAYTFYSAQLCSHLQPSMCRHRHGGGVIVLSVHMCVYLCMYVSVSVKYWYGEGQGTLCLLFSETPSPPLSDFTLIEVLTRRSASIIQNATIATLPNKTAALKYSSNSSLNTHTHSHTHTHLCLNSHSPPFSEQCTSPPVVGPCKGIFPRWYYDPNAGECKHFIYGGCKGNHNNFLQEADCVSECIQIPGKGLKCQYFFNALHNKSFMEL